MSSVTYDILFQPPNIDPPTGLTITDLGAGKLRVALVHPTEATLRYSFVQISDTSGDYTDAFLYYIPSDTTQVDVFCTLTGTIYAQAIGADAWGNFSVPCAEVTVASVQGFVSGTIWVPVMDGLGNVMTDSGDGSAIMAEITL